jgi:hypothetical protein
VKNSGKKAGGGVSGKSPGGGGGVQTGLVTADSRVLGRPTTLTPEIADKLVALTEAGLPFATACAANGVPRSTAYDWLRSGRPGCRELRARLEQARAAAEASLWRRLTADALHNPWAAARTLEAMYPERWAPPGDPRRRSVPDWPDAPSRCAVE